MMRKLGIIAVMTLCLVMLTAGVAFAAHTDLGDRTGWAEMSAKGCSACHDTADKHTSGPHGGYTSTTTRCIACHKVHKAANAKLLPGATVTEACNFCHDLTGTDVAPYFASDIPTTNIKSAHKVFGTVAGTVYFATYGSLTIPGGDDATGGNATLNTTGTGDLSATAFTCDSCHTPHALAAKVVDKYLGESHVKATSYGMPAGTEKIYLTNRILRRTVNGVDVGTTYGSAWCIGCHQGRDNNHAGVFNHPVNASGLGYDLLGTGMANGVSFINSKTAADVTAAGYVYVDTRGTPDPGAHLNGDPRSNKWYAMIANDPLNGDAPRPDGSVAYAVYSGPSCQQCHASPRDVDAAFWAAFNTEGPGYPSRGTFPHLSTNKALLAESGDDFCTNCHGTANLP
ncbi:putative multiheme cytochrome c [Thermincola ferriacetica]|uniref:Putative multiheme cytochrome c n=1 Tax=Thermincola ferriacetica TaxID=281456 RepID=A0A0L6W0U9_9FIRM|nr:cytochrome c3 family protein [Thermincola ferriacetica]KNZ69207.1 putative multiheme cytochrome c [Thermincola ferriacetica]